MAALATVRVLVSVKLQSTRRAGFCECIEDALDVVAGNALGWSSARTRHACSITGVALLCEIISVGAWEARVAGGHGVVEVGINVVARDTVVLGGALTGGARLVTGGAAHLVVVAVLFCCALHARVPENVQVRVSDVAGETVFVSGPLTCEAVGVTELAR